MPSCPRCDAEVLDIDVKCAQCGAPLGSTGAQRMVGVVVLGQYEIVDVLGSGGMSVVYKARHKITEQEVALKLLPPELAAHAQVKSRFLEEARALAQLDHPNIVHLYNFGQENGAFCLAMQYVHGQTWERMILSGGRMDWPLATKIAIDVLRDMKPSNVLVKDSDGSATVMDFGIAKMTTSTKLTATGQTMGTVRYMSPEQVRGQEVDPRTDLYSLGATLYEAVVGDTPFDGNTHFEIMTKHLHEPPRPPSVLGVAIPPALETALLRALAKKPADRFESARDFRKALEAVLKTADVGLMETQRMSRESVPPARAPAAGAATSGGDAASAGDGGVTAPGRRIVAPAASVPRAPDAADRGTGLASRLEPTGDHPAVPRRRTGLWLGLGALVAAAGAAVAVLMVRDAGGDERAGAPAGGGPPRADAAATSPARGFVPPFLTIARSEADQAQQLTVHVVGDTQPSEVISAWRQVRGRFDAYLAERQLAAALPAPLTVVVVPRATLCDVRIFESGEAPADCATLTYYYRPAEQTLLVVEDRARLLAHLGGGVAFIACLHGGVAAVCDLLDGFEKQLGESGGGERKPGHAGEPG
jgi:serine/threonine-protein kinase